MEPCFHPCTYNRLVMQGGFCMARKDTWRILRAKKAQLGGVGIKHTKLGGQGNGHTHMTAGAGGCRRGRMNSVVPPAEPVSARYSTATPPPRLHQAPPPPCNQQGYKNHCSKSLLKQLFHKLPLKYQNANEVGRKVLGAYILG
jgi:hypothetical protein